MWRDPLDELIDDLERVAPAPRSASADLLPIENLQQFTDIILYGSPDEVEMLKADPVYQLWIRQRNETRGRLKVEGPGVSGLASLDRTVHTGSNH